MELVDMRDLESRVLWTCRFDSYHSYQTQWNDHGTSDLWKVANKASSILASATNFSSLVKWEHSGL